MLRVLKKCILALLKVVRLKGVLLGLPTKHVSVRVWVKNHPNEDNSIVDIFESANVTEKSPVIVNHVVSRRFLKHSKRTTRQAFVARIRGAKVLGEDCNIIISPDNLVFEEVSREFGAEGGRKIESFSIFKNRLRMPRVKKIGGKIAVVSTCGSSNFHHWNFDVLPRFLLLQKAGYFNEIDKFILNYKGLPFQKEGLKKIGLDESRIINSAGVKDFYVQADCLYIPSLTEDLGTITPWVIDFLRDVFLGENKHDSLNTAKTKLYISRANAPTRNIKNKEEVMGLLKSYQYQEFFPEEFTMEQCALHFASASSIVSVHGSGLSNLPFISKGTKVLDILAPYHQDTYYWMMANQRSSFYVGLFSEGVHPPDDLDLVVNKVDEDLHIDIDKMKMALDLIS